MAPRVNKVANSVICERVQPWVKRIFCFRPLQEENCTLEFHMVKLTCSVQIRWKVWAFYVKAQLSCWARFIAEGPLGTPYIQINRDWRAEQEFKQSFPDSKVIVLKFLHHLEEANTGHRLVMSAVSTFCWNSCPRRLNKFKWNAENSAPLLC